MTIEIKVTCDARDCVNETEIQDDHDSSVEAEGWTVSPDCGYTNY